MNYRLPQWLRHAMYNLRGGFLVRPLIIALTLGFAGAMFSWLEETFPFLSDFVPRALFPSHADPQVAQVLLGGIAASIMTVVSIVFAIVLMTLTLASMQFSPRIIVSFARDRVTQWTLGIFLGTFCYCMAALPAARSLSIIRFQRWHRIRLRIILPPSPRVRLCIPDYRLAPRRLRALCQPAFRWRQRSRSE